MSQEVVLLLVQAVMRGLEKFMIVGGAITCVVLGYKLFKITTAKDTEVTIFKGDSFGARIGNASPGLLIALAGVVLMGYSLATVTKAEVKTKAFEQSASIVAPLENSGSQPPVVIAAASVNDVADQAVPASVVKAAEVPAEPKKPIATVITESNVEVQHSMVATYPALQAR